MICAKKLNYFKSLKNTVIRVERKNDDSNLFFLEEIDDEGNIYGKTCKGGVEQQSFINYDFIGSINSTKIVYDEYRERERKKL